MSKAVGEEAAFEMTPEGPLDIRVVTNWKAALVALGYSLQRRRAGVSLNVQAVY